MGGSSPQRGTSILLGQSACDIVRTWQFMMSLTLRPCRNQPDGASDGRSACPDSGDRDRSGALFRCGIVVGRQQHSVRQRVLPDTVHGRTLSRGNLHSVTRLHHDRFTAFPKVSQIWMWRVIKPLLTTNVVFPVRSGSSGDDCTLKYLITTCSSLGVTRELRSILVSCSTITSGTGLSAGRPNRGYNRAGCRRLECGGRTRHGTRPDPQTRTHHPFRIFLRITSVDTGPGGEPRVPLLDHPIAVWRYQVEDILHRVRCRRHRTKGAIEAFTTLRPGS